MSDFETSIYFVLQNEGGFIDNPNDMGSATNFGISTSMLTISRQKGVTVDDVKNLTLVEAKEIYRTYFWDKMSLEELPQPIATAVLDMSVNMGQGRASFFAQMAIGQPNPDGILGPKTRLELSKSKPSTFIYRFVMVIQDYYCDTAIKNEKQLCFLKGWVRRAFRLMTLIENQDLA